MANLQKLYDAVQKTSVPSEGFIEAVEGTGANIVCLSALPGVNLS